MVYNSQLNYLSFIPSKNYYQNVASYKSYKLITVSIIFYVDKYLAFFIKFGNKTSLLIYNKWLLDIVYNN